MEPTQELIDAIWRSKVETAKQMSPADKLLAGPQLFHDLLQWMKAGIRNQFPNASEEEVTRQLERRLAIAERLEGR